MGIQNRKDALSGIVLAGFGLFVLYHSSQLAYLSEFGPGPGFLPRWLSIGLFLLACLLAVNGFIRPSDVGDGEKSWSGTARALASWAGLMAGIALLSRAGFILSFALLCAFLVLLVDRRPLRTAIAVAVGSALGFYLIFTLSLGVPLPAGPWGF